MIRVAYPVPAMVRWFLGSTTFSLPFLVQTFPPPKPSLNLKGKLDLNLAARLHNSGVWGTCLLLRATVPYGNSGQLPEVTSGELILSSILSLPAPEHTQSLGSSNPLIPPIISRLSLACVSRCPHLQPGDSTRRGRACSSSVHAVSPRSPSI